jgi:hypothetical protein
MRIVAATKPSRTTRERDIPSDSMRLQTMETEKSKRPRYTASIPTTPYSLLTPITPTAAMAPARIGQTPCVHSLNPGLPGRLVRCFIRSMLRGHSLGRQGRSAATGRDKGPAARGHLEHRGPRPKVPMARSRRHHRSRARHPRRRRSRRPGHAPDRQRCDQLPPSQGPSTLCPGSPQRFAWHRGDGDPSGRTVGSTRRAAPAPATTPTPCQTAAILVASPTDGTGPYQRTRLRWTPCNGQTWGTWFVRCCAGRPCPVLVVDAGPRIVPHYRDLATVATP